MDDEDKDNEIFDIFKKVSVNIPLLIVIKQIPKYTKFLKDLCTHKRRLNGNQRVNIGRNVHAFIQPKAPKKSTIEQNVLALTQAMPPKLQRSWNLFYSMYHWLDKIIMLSTSSVIILKVLVFIV